MPGARQFNSQPLREPSGHPHAAHWHVSTGVGGGARSDDVSAICTDVDLPGKGAPRA